MTTTDTRPDLVNHPPHYIGDGLQAIDVIEDWQLGFHLGNAAKYILRAGRKGSRVEDLEKAQWYIARAAVFGWPPFEGSLSHADIAGAFSLSPVLSDALALLLNAAATGDEAPLRVCDRRLQWQISLWGQK